MFDSLFVNVSSSNEEKVIVATYGIGKGKNYSTHLYPDGCPSGLEMGTAINVTGGSAIVKKDDALTPMKDEPMSSLKLTYVIDLALLALSDMWNNKTRSIELCQVVELTQEHKGSALTIVQDIRNITVAFDLTAEFNITVDLDAAVIEAVNETENFADYISAYYCNGEDDMLKLEEESKLQPNEEMDICIASTSSDVEIEEIESMASTICMYISLDSYTADCDIVAPLSPMQIIRGKDSSSNDEVLKVMKDGKASLPSITTFRFVNDTHFICTTRVPTNLFDYEAPEAFVTVEGSLALKLGDGNVNRKLMTADQSGGDLRQLQVAAGNGEASFGFSINLESGEADEYRGIPPLASAVEAHDGLGVMVVILAIAINTLW